MKAETLAKIREPVRSLWWIWNLAHIMALFRTSDEFPWLIIGLALPLGLTIQGRKPLWEAYLFVWWFLTAYIMVDRQLRPAYQAIEFTAYALVLTLPLAVGFVSAWLLAKYRETKPVDGLTTWAPPLLGGLSLVFMSWGKSGFYANPVQICLQGLWVSIALFRDHWQTNVKRAGLWLAIAAISVFAVQLLSPAAGLNLPKLLSILPFWLLGLALGSGLLWGSRLLPTH